MCLILSAIKSQSLPHSAEFFHFTSMRDISDNCIIFEIQSAVSECSGRRKLIFWRTNYLETSFKDLEKYLTVCGFYYLCSCKGVTSASFRKTLKMLLDDSRFYLNVW